MSISIGSHIPNATLREFVYVASEGCPLGPNAFQVSELVKGKTIALFAVPGAFTPTCSEKHVPGFLEHHAQFKAAGIDEIWCVSVNDAFVMGAWGEQQHVQGKIRMFGDGSAEFTKAMGLELDLTGGGLGIRSQRFSALIVDGVVKQLNVDERGKLEVSDANTLLKQVQAA